MRGLLRDREEVALLVPELGRPGRVAVAAVLAAHVLENPTTRGRADEADADLEAAIDGALFGVFINQGEVCSAGSRILVEKPIYSKCVEAFSEKAKRIK